MMHAVNANTGAVYENTGDHKMNMEQQLRRMAYLNMERGLQYSLIISVYACQN